MKKLGFTLAEVLITLTIIGVVAMMTLPALMTNVNEQAAKTSLKKICSMLTDIGQLSQATEGFDYSTISDTGMDESKSTLLAMLHPRLNVDEAKSSISNCTAWDNSTPPNCTTYANKRTTSSILFSTKNSDIVLFLKDNTVLMFDPLQSATAEYKTVYYDINGAKKPNAISMCAANGNFGANKGKGLVVTTARPTISTAADISLTNCTKPTERFVADQFVLRLKGIYAEPGNDIAKYLYDR